MNEQAGDRFSLTGKVAIVTGGAGLLGVKHAEAVAEMGGIPVLIDLRGKEAAACAKKIARAYRVHAMGFAVDVTKPAMISDALAKILSEFGRVDILINNAANNPKVEGKHSQKRDWSRFEHLALKVWERDVSVGLTGAFLCSQIIGSEMARQKHGVILNIASELSVIAPDQRIYRHADLPEDQQPVKSASYVVVKAGLLGLTRYLAAYWAKQGVRVNVLSPGGVFANQDSGFVQRLSDLIPMGRMAHPDEYKAAVVFLISDASSYMTGANLIVDGGRSCW